ncbi:Uncharacterised protein [BD1-7 clade bacterium]|uniref:Chromosome partition protein Smc n=1 Tax=BD1-7 clade bacterium TaxID=2029982 RepID=A0A5S9NB67_9GAMM|nr:Uncharacterised protein [BD1-7 clade bacterium]
MTKKKHLIAIALTGIACSVPVSAKMVEVPAYGQIPYAATLCTYATTSASLGANISAGTGMEGSAGGGWLEALFADIEAIIEVPVGAEIGQTATAAIYTKNCVSLNADNQKELQNGNSDNAHLVRSVYSQVDMDKVTLGIIKNAVSLNAAVGTSRSVIQNYDIIAESLTDAFVSADPLDMGRAVSTVKDVAENSKAMIHPRVYDTLTGFDKAMQRHIGNLDVIGKSCNDLYSGNITHLPPELIERLDYICEDWKDIQSLTTTFVGDLNQSIGKAADAAKQMTALVGNAETLKGVSNSIGVVVDEIDQTADTVGDSVNRLNDTVGQTRELIDRSTSGAQKIIGGSLGTVQDTVNAVNASASNAGSSATTGLNKLNTEVQTTLDIVESLSIGSVAQLPVKIAQERLEAAEEAVAQVAGEVCDLGISGPLGFSVDVADIPGVSDVLDCD